MFPYLRRSLELHEPKLREVMIICPHCANMQPLHDGETDRVHQGELSIVALMNDFASPSLVPLRGADNLCGAHNTIGLASVQLCHVRDD